MDQTAISNMMGATRLLAQIMPERAKLLPYDRNMVEDMAEKLNRLGANAQVTPRQIHRLEDILSELTAAPASPSDQGSPAPKTKAASEQS